ncbi:MAG: hypothetical protein V1854_01135 [Methanobacteriota archaeon]
MDGKSLDITQERINKLKEILPDAFTEGKIDWEKLQASLGENIEFKNERYVLNWAGKSDAFRVLQSPTTATLVPCKEESVGFDDTENIFIEGENLEVLKVLQKSYFGKIKMIYIDPPYNTGNDKFIYPDKFSESRDDIEFYFKLPFWFKIKTPIGNYNPDWALIKKNEKTVYFVAETKSAGQELKISEKRKIDCGKAHFKEFNGVEYKQVATVSDLD